MIPNLDLNSVRTRLGFGIAYSLIRRSPIIGEKKGRELRAGWLSLLYQERNLVVPKGGKLISKSQEKAR